MRVQMADAWHSNNNKILAKIYQTFCSFMHSMSMYFSSFFFLKIKRMVKPDIQEWFDEALKSQCSLL